MQEPAIASDADRCLSPIAESGVDDVRPGEAMPSRRDVVRGGVKLAFVAPVISTFFAQQAYAGYSCYPLGHDCDAASETKRQACCDALVCDGDPGTCQ